MKEPLIQSSIVHVASAGWHPPSHHAIVQGLRATGVAVEVVDATGPIQGQGLGRLWHILPPEQRIALLCCSAAQGAEQVTRFCAERFRAESESQFLEVKYVRPRKPVPHDSASAGQDKLVGMLLDLGADPFTVNAANTQPIYGGTNEALLRSLEEQKIDLSAQNSHGDTLFHRLAAIPDLARENHYLKAFLVCLMLYKKDHPNESLTKYVNITNNKGLTALDLARASGSLKMVMAIMKLGGEYSDQWGKNNERKPDPHRRELWTTLREGWMDQ